MTCSDMLSMPLSHDRRSGIIKLRFNRLVALLRCWQRRTRERRQLAAMGSLAWRDLGLSDVDVRREVNKPFWRD
ncbi:DUF1127 domain-containing protein [Ferrovibrio sp.]|jgi:uncharacterized protein YjiS (DUF1127 family)|uniref:DUF1127 domain-containing protein n=1 Tax=Ferrovibrio sp. TaxID=1917215 RepID=UPI0035ADD6B2